MSTTVSYSSFNVQHEKSFVPYRAQIFTREMQRGSQMAYLEPRWYPDGPSGLYMGPTSHSPHGTHLNPICTHLGPTWGPRCKRNMGTIWGIWVPYCPIWVPYGQPIWYPHGIPVLPTWNPDGPHIFCYLGIRLRAVPDA